MKTLLGFCGLLGLALSVAFGQDARDVQESIVIDHPSFDQKNSARDLTNKYNTHGHENTVEKQTVPPLVDSVQSLSARQKTKAVEKKKLIQKRDTFVRQKVSEARQNHIKALRAMDDAKARSEPFDELTARRAAERQWSKEHKQEAKQLKAVESSGLTVPPLMNR